MWSLMVPSDWVVFAVLTRRDQMNSALLWYPQHHKSNLSKSSRVETSLLTFSEIAEPVQDQK